MMVPLIAGIIVLAVIVAIAASQRSGPRITRIERRTRNDEGDDA